MSAEATAGSPVVLNQLQIVDSLPPGEDQIDAAGQAVELADESGDVWGAAQARILLVAALEAAGRHEPLVEVLRWLLDRLETSPESLTVRQRFEIVWETRFGLRATRESVGIDRDQVYSFYDQVERCLQRDGVGARFFSWQRTLLARDAESDWAAQAWLDRWRKAPRDEYADCAACEIADDARFLAERGNYARALKGADDLLAGRLGCHHEPHRILGEAADWSMQVGRPDAAEEYHRRGWLLVTGRPEFQRAWANHVLYLLRAGRPGRAMRLATGLLTEQDTSGLTDRDRQFIGAVLTMVLRAAREHGASGLLLGLDEESLEAAIGHRESATRRLARSFDNRNHTTSATARLDRLWAQSRYPTDASEDVRLSDGLDRLALREVGGSPSGTADPARERFAFRDTVLSVASELRLAGAELDAPRIRRLIDTWLTMRDSAEFENNQEHLAAAYLERRALTSRRAANDEHFVDELLSSARKHAELSGKPAAVFRVEIEELHRRGLNGDVHAWQTARKLIDDLVRAGSYEDAASGLMSISRHPDPSQGLADATRAAELFAMAKLPKWRVLALQAAGYAALWCDPDRAEQLLDQAEAGARELHLPAALVTITATRGRLAWQRGDADTAIALIRQAAGTREHSVDPAGLQAELCELLAAQQQWEDLIDESHQLLRLLDREPPGDHDSGPMLLPRALAHRWLGLGLIETGNPAEAAEVLSPAVPLLADHPDGPVTAWTFGRALIANGRGDLAVPHLEFAGRKLAGRGETGDAAWALIAAGTHAADPAHAESVLRLAAMAASMAHQREPLVAALQAVADLQAANHRVDDALNTLGTVPNEVLSAAGEEVPEEAQQHLLGLLELQAGAILRRAGRTVEAREMLQVAEKRLADYGTDDDVQRVVELLAALPR